MKQSPQKSNTELFSLKDLVKYLGVLRRNLIYLILIPLFFGLVGYFYSYKMPDIYGASCQLLINSSSTYDYQDKLYDNIGYYTNYENLQNQQRVITSKDLIKKALDRLNFEISYFIVGRIRTIETLDGVPFKISGNCINRELYEKEIYIQVLSDKECELTYKSGSEEKTVIVAFGTKLINTDLNLSIERSFSFTEGFLDDIKNVNYYFVIHNQANLINKYASSITVENIENTSILMVTVEDVLAEKAVVFLDTLASVYIRQTTDSKKQISDNTIYSINEQVDTVTQILKGIEDTLQIFNTNNEVIELSKEEQSYFNQYEKFDNMNRNLLMRFNDLISLENYIDSLDVKQEKTLPSSFYVGERDEFLENSIEDLYRLQIARTSRLISHTEKSAEIKNLDDRLALIKTNLLIYINNTKEAIKDRLASVRKEIDFFRSKLTHLPITQRGMRIITRRLNINEKLLQFLQEKKFSTIISKAGIIPETKIIEAPRSLGRIKPDKKKYLVYFSLAGFLLASLYVFWRETFMRKVATVLELTELTKIPVLGQIYSLKDLEAKQIAITDPKSGASESFRAIRTNLQYFSPGSHSKLILITSVVPGEGKTFCSINLANIIAKANKKVLLVELDMHKPRIYKAFAKTGSTIGITSFLIGNSEFNQVIEKTDNEYLDVALCGPIPPNPSEMVLFDSLGKFLETARREYDFVIIDTPPVGLISDALAIMKYTDVNIFVFNTKTTRKQEVLFIDEVINRNQLQNCAAVLNGVMQSRIRYYYSKYSYGYGYGYGYSYGYGKNKSSSEDNKLT